MPSWFQKNIVENPILNPVGWVAGQVRRNNGGTADQRVSDWSKKPDSAILPGCMDGNPLNSNCQWSGTNADWEQYRVAWIDRCVASNNNGFLTSKNKTHAQCQALFDTKAQGIQLELYAENKTALDDLKGMIDSNKILYIAGGAVFIGLIIYLLTSE